MTSHPQILFLSRRGFPASLTQQIQGEFECAFSEDVPTPLNATLLFVDVDTVNWEHVPRGIPMLTFANQPDKISESAEDTIGIYSFQEPPEHLIQLCRYLLNPRETSVSSLKSTIDELQEFGRLKSEFLANISHELQSPLTPLEGYIELFLSGELGAVMEAQQDVLEIMQSCTRRLKTQIENLIFLGGLERVQGSQDVDEFYFHDCLQSLKRIFKFQIQQKNLDLKFELDARHSYVSANLQQISKLIMVLLDNAIKFSKMDHAILLSSKNISTRGLKLKKEACEQNPHQVCLSFLPPLLSDEQLYLEVSITDTGAGIPEEKLTHIFDAFYQVDGSSTREYGGVGVGLNIAQKILMQHHSFFCIESQEKQGTRVSFVLPVVSI